MKKILLTGSSGFVGSHVLPLLREKYEVLAPTRSELNIKDRKSVNLYFANRHFDAVVHLASPSPLKSPTCDSFDTLFRDCVVMFLNLLSVSSHFDKLIYSGSGAEYDKTRDIISAKEEKIGDTLPNDEYGMAKYVLNQLTRQSEKCYNLRIFGCYGPGEYDYKFIKHVIQCIKENNPITIKQDCYFDYLYVDDYAKIIEFIVDNKPKYHDYNACTGTRTKLSDIAYLAKEITNSDVPVIIENKAMNLEYTGSNERLMSEAGEKLKLTDLKEGIKQMMFKEGIII